MKKTTETKAAQGQSPTSGQPSNSGDQDPKWREMVEYYGSPEDEDTPSIAGVSERIKSDLAWLYEKSAGKNSHAFMRLVDATVLGTQLVKKLTDADLTLANAVAARRSFWPISISRSKSFPENREELLKKLSLDEQGELPFDVFKRFSNKAGSPARGLVVQALLLIYTYRRVQFFTSTFLGVSTSAQTMQECLASGEVPESDRPLALKKIALALRARDSATKSVISFSRHTQIVFATLVDMLTFSASEGKESMFSPSITLLNHAFPPIILQFPPVLLSEEVLPLVSKTNTVLDSILNLPQLAIDTEALWVKAVLDVILLPCAEHPLRSKTLHTIGKSSEDKSYLQAAAGDVNAVPAIKEIRKHKKSPHTNVLDTALRVLRNAVKPVLRAHEIRNSGAW